MCQVCSEDNLRLKDSLQESTFLLMCHLRIDVVSLICSFFVLPSSSSAYLIVRSNRAAAAAAGTECIWHRRCISLASNTPRSALTSYVRSNPCARTQLPVFGGEFGLVRVCTYVRYVSWPEFSCVHHALFFATVSISAIWHRNKYWMRSHATGQPASRWMDCCIARIPNVRPIIVKAFPPSVRFVHFLLCSSPIASQLSSVSLALHRCHPFPSHFHSLSERANSCPSVFLDSPRGLKQERRKEGREGNLVTATYRRTFIGKLQLFLGREEREKGIWCLFLLSL